MASNKFFQDIEIEFFNESDNFTQLLYMGFGIIFGIGGVVFMSYKIKK